MAEPLGILLLSRSHERVHFGFVLAAGAAALGTRVTLFATNGGLHGLCRDWSGLDGSDRDAEIRARGVAGLDDLREACAALGVRLLACDAGLRAEDLPPERLRADVEIAGVTTFLAGAGRMVSI
jgi:peroxiredoxin family protein